MPLGGLVPLGGLPLFGRQDDDASGGNHAIIGDSGNPLKDIATGYTRSMPEPVQIAAAPVTAVSRQFDANPGATLRAPEEGPTDKFGDRRGLLDGIGDTFIERGHIENFEDDSDLPGTSVGDFMKNPSGATNKTLGQLLQFARGNWTVHGEDGDPPDNPDGSRSGLLVTLAIAGILLFGAIVALGQLFDIQV